LLLGHTFEHWYFRELRSYHEVIQLDDYGCASVGGDKQKAKLQSLLHAYHEAPKEVPNSTAVAVVCQHRSLGNKHWFALYHVRNTPECERHLRDAGYFFDGMWVSAGSFMLDGRLQPAVPDPIFARRLSDASMRGIERVLLPDNPVGFAVEYVGRLTDLRSERIARVVQHAPASAAKVDTEIVGLPGTFLATEGPSSKYGFMTNNCGSFVAWLLGSTNSLCHLRGFEGVANNLRSENLSSIENPSAVGGSAVVGLNFSHFIL
jgi:hypothetical protein